MGKARTQAGSSDLIMIDNSNIDKLHLSAWVASLAMKAGSRGGSP